MEAESEINFKQYTFNNVKILQYICVTITTEASVILLINVYSPFGYVGEANAELGLILRETEALHRTNTVIMEDFNMPSLTWIEDEEFPGVFLPFGNECTELFINTFFDHNLVQIMEPPSTRNHLDLAFVSDINSCRCTYPIEKELIDRISLRHAPFVVNFHVVTAVADKVSYLNFGRTNLKKAKQELRNVSFDIISEDEAMLEQWSNNTIATSKIMNNMNIIKDAVLMNTPLRRVNRSWISRHPWLKNSKEYERSRSHKIDAKKFFLSDPFGGQ